MTTVEERKTEEAKPTPPAGMLSRVLFGLALILVGIGWLLDRVGWLELRLELVAPALLLMVGAALMVGAFEEAHPGLIVGGAFLVVFTLMAGLAPIDAFGAGVGNRTFRVVDPATLQPAYEVGAGQLVLDLTDLQGPVVDSTRVEVGAGDVTVLLPPNHAVEVQATVGAGEISLFGETIDGLRLDADETLAGDGLLQLDIEVGVGNIEVTR